MVKVLYSPMGKCPDYTTGRCHVDPNTSGLLLLLLFFTWLFFFNFILNLYFNYYFADNCNTVPRNAVGKKIKL